MSLLSEQRKEMDRKRYREALRQIVDGCSCMCGGEDSDEWCWPAPEDKDIYDWSHNNMCPRIIADKVLRPGHYLKLLKRYGQ